MKSIIILFTILFVTKINYSQQVSEVWNRTFNGTGNSTDEIRAIATDNFGNIYTTGRSITAGQEYNIITIKYSPDGDIIWINNYDSGGGKIDEPSCIAVRNNFVVVGGLANYFNGKSEYLVLGINSNGTFDWDYRVSPAANNNYQQCVSIGFDYQGFIFATGFLTNVVYLRNFFTVKLTTSGNLVDSVMYTSGGITSFDEATGMVIDKLGNVYVAGYERPSTSYDIVTIKYNNNLDQVWLRKYDKSSVDVVTSNCISLDSNSNIFVAGRKDNYENGPIVAFKYDNNGNLKWDRIYEGSIYLTFSGTDRLGNFLVTGRINSSNYNWITIKFNSNYGDTLWVRKLVGSAFGDNIPQYLQIDPKSNVYVGGFVSNVGTGEDFKVVKYKPDGSIDWHVNFDGTNRNDRINCIVLDMNLNVYAGGYTDSLGQGLNYELVKYSQTTHTLQTDTAIGVVFDFDMAIDVLDPIRFLNAISEIKKLVSIYDTSSNVVLVVHHKAVKFFDELGSSLELNVKKNYLKSFQREINALNYLGVKIYLCQDAITTYRVGNIYNFCLRTAFGTKKIMDLQDSSYSYIKPQ